MHDCIFCKIINKNIQAEVILENEDIFAFVDIKPLAPVHILIIPKEHIPTIDDLESKHQNLIGKMILAAQKIAREKNIAEGGYKLLFRVKEHGGQEVDHLHLHLIGGAPLTEGIHAINRKLE